MLQFLRQPQLLAGPLELNPDNPAGFDENPIRSADTAEPRDFANEPSRQFCATNDGLFYSGFRHVSSIQTT